MWQKLYHSNNFMIAKAKIAAEGLVIGSMQAKLVIPQQPIKYELEP
jgi:hypothetical protein